MREIKFRAWDKFEKRFSYIHVHPCGIQWASPDWLDQGLSHDTHGNIHGVQFAGISSIQQYTGLKDKNGKEIYEGDVVKRTIYPLNQYSYDEYYQIKELNYYIYKGEKYGHFNVSLWSTDCEVIGNIHETPELLEGENG